jgi:hypothetical protein
MFNTVAVFLLDHPPLEEIGGPILDIVENYREGFITKQKALDDMLKNHQNFLQNYIDRAASIAHSHSKIKDT